MRYFLWLAFNFLLFAGFSQSNKDSVIGFACGKAARPSQSIVQLENLMVSEQYDSIRALIWSNSPVKQYLASKIGEYLESKKKLILTDYDKEGIRNLKKADYTITYCQGCTVREEFSIGKLYLNNSHPLNKDIHRWLKKHIR